MWALGGARAALLSPDLEGSTGIPGKAEGLTVVRQAQHILVPSALWMWEWGRLFNT